MSRQFAKLVSRAVFASAALLISTSAFAQNYLLEMNRTQVIHLPTAASAIVIGNPQIADVSVHSPDTIFLVGRGFGETNLIVLDQAGHTVMDANVTVSNKSSTHTVRVHNLGDNRKTYSCTPYCSPAPVLGDDPAFLGSFTGSGQTINNNTASGALTSPPTSSPQNLQPFGMSNLHGENAPNNFSSENF